MLFTAEELLVWLKLPPGSPADPILATIATAVVADCAHYVDRPLEWADATERYTGNGGGTIQLRRYPVTIVDTVKIGDGSALVEGWDKDFVVDGAAGLLIITSGGWPMAPPQSIEVKYTAGYVHALSDPAVPGETVVPADLKMSLLKAAAFQYFAQDKRRAGIESVTTPDQSITYVTSEYPRDVLNVWRRHRRMNVG